MLATSFSFRALLPAFLSLICGTALTLASLLWSQQEARQSAQEQFSQESKQLIKQIEERLHLHAEALRGIQNVLQIQPTLSQAQFQELLDRQNLQIRLPGFSAILLIHPAASKNKPLHEIKLFYPRNATTTELFNPPLAFWSATHSLFWQSPADTRGQVSPAFWLPGKTAAHFLLCYSMPASQSPAVLCALYRIDHLLSSVNDRYETKISQLQMTDRGKPLDRSQPASHQALRVQNDIQGGHELHVQQLITLPGRQWQLAAWASSKQFPGLHSELPWILLLLGSGFTLILTVLAVLYVRAHEMGVRLAQDITSDLRKHEDHHLMLEALVDTSPDLIVVRNEHGRICHANPAALTTFSDSAISLYARRDALLLSAELGQPTEVLKREASHTNASGWNEFYDVQILPLQWLGEQGTAMVARNKTALHLKLEDLYQTTTRQSDFLALSGDFFWELDAAGCFIYVAGGFLARYQLTPHYFIGKTLQELSDGLILETQWANFDEAIAQRATFESMDYTLWIDHEPIQLSLSGKPILEQGPQLVCFRGVGRDISALHKMQRALIDEQQRGIATLDSISDGIITTDLKGCIDYLNPVACALTGWEHADALGQDIELVLQIVDLKNRLPLPTLLHKALASGLAPQNHRSGILLNRFGLNFLIQEAVACVRDHQGEIIGAAVVFRDLTDWNDRLPN